jgi:AmmeMemoRadiSam system protein A
MLEKEHKQQLLEIARGSIRHGLEKNTGLKLSAEDYPETLRETLATFVTLKIDTQLRGCIGTTQAISPLVISVSENAWSSAFRDPRFNPLTYEEFESIHIGISILTPTTPVTFRTEKELLEQLRQDIDGLIIEKDGQRATFLPSVWEALQKPEDFLQQLKLKAGMRPEVCPEKAWRYETIAIEE